MKLLEHALRGRENSWDFSQEILKPGGLKPGWAL